MQGAVGTQRRGQADQGWNRCAACLDCTRRLHAACCALARLLTSPGPSVCLTNPCLIRIKLRSATSLPSDRPVSRHTSSPALLPSTRRSEPSYCMPAAYLAVTKGALSARQQGALSTRAAAGTPGGLLSWVLLPPGARTTCC